MHVDDVGGEDDHEKPFTDEEIADLRGMRVAYNQWGWLGRLLFKVTVGTGAIILALSQFTTGLGQFRAYLASILKGSP